MISLEKNAFAERFHRSTRHQDAEPCRNCGMEYVGNFCPECGQEAHTGAPTAVAFIYEFLTRNVFERGKLPRTIWHLLRYPGGLTIDFLEGRRQRFIRPVRLYFGLSVLYFLILSFNNSITQNIKAERVDGAPRSGSNVELNGGDAKKGVHITSKAIAKKGRTASKDDGDDWDLQLDFLDKLPDSGMAGQAKKKLKRFSDLPHAERRPALIKGMLDQAPKAMFLLLPIFALLLKVLFVFRRIPYGAHLLFSLNYHSLVFFCLLLMFTPLPEAVLPFMAMGMWVYLWLALRKVYLCGWFGALLRVWALTMMYSIAVLLAIMAAFFAAILV